MSYIKTTWNTGDVVTAEKLNNIEDGISGKQDTLIAGENITISGNIISASVSGTNYTIPSYFESNMTTKINSIKNDLETAGPAGDSFVFITDSHAPGYAYCVSGTSIPRSFRLANYIIQNTQVKKIILGGDILQGSANLATTLSTIDSIVSYVHPKATLLPIRGNHDGWVSNSVRQLPLNKYFYHWMPNKDKIKDFQYTNMTNNTTGEAYYYMDNEAQKIRYIFTDSIYSAEDSGSVITSNIQLAWMQNRITELPSDWAVLVLHHGLWTAGKTSTLNLNTDGNAVLDAVNDIYITAQCEIIGIVVGHVHRDIDGTSVHGFPYVGTTCDANGAQASYDIVTPTRSSGTTTESALDVVTINRNTRTINFRRIGTCGSDRSYTWPSRS